MAAGLPLAAALERGALLTGANWPVVLIDFAIESLYKLALGVPIVGGAVMVAVVVGVDLPAVLAGGLWSAAEVVLGSLAGAPLAFAAFVAAAGLVAAGGAVLMFIVKAGTLAIIADADRRAAELQWPPVRLGAISAASADALPRLLEQTRRFARRAAALALGLCAAYLAIALGYAGVVALGFSAASDSALAALWPLVVVAGAMAAVVAVAGVNLVYDLVRVAIVTDDCGVLAAAQRVRRFVLADARHVLGIFAVMTAAQTVAAVAGLTLAAGLTTVAFVPFAGLAVLPLQLTAWLVRGLLFQSLTFTALAAYLTQYRRFREPPRQAAPFRKQQA
jgi:hypothetical protein